jgi:Class III cytochrome C family
MAQTFRPAANVIAKVSIFCAVAGIGLLVALAYGLDRGAYTTDVRVVKDQPVPFSHKHHAGDDGIDCRYCHTSVETSAYAGVPATEICMSCHAQLWPDAAILEPVRESYRTICPISSISITVSTSARESAAPLATVVWIRCH